MKKLHMCCGDIYLSGYENCDITGHVIDKDKTFESSEQFKDVPDYNPNETTLENYFKRPFEEDSTKRPEKFIIVDTIMNILEKWPWGSGTVDEIVMVNALEHFDYKEQVPHIINEANRVLKVGGSFKLDFPDVLEIVRKYYHHNPHYCMELLYGSRKNQYSRHEWGYTKNSIYTFFPESQWSLKFRNVVIHDYPSTGIFAIKK